MPDNIQCTAHGLKLKGIEDVGWTPQSIQGLTCRRAGGSPKDVPLASSDIVDWVIATGSFGGLAVAHDLEMPVSPLGTTYAVLDDKTLHLSIGGDKLLSFIQFLGGADGPGAQPAPGAAGTPSGCKVVVDPQTGAHLQCDNTSSAPAPGGHNCKTVNYTDIVCDDSSGTATIYTSADGRFTVNFPRGEVKQSSQTISLRGGGITILHQFSEELANGRVSYSALYCDYEASEVSGDPQAVLTRSRNGAVKNKKLLTDTVISLNGVPGREFTAKDRTWNYTMRQYLQGKRLYQLIVVSDNAHPATQISDFMNSFKVELAEMASSQPANPVSSAPPTSASASAPLPASTPAPAPAPVAPVFDFSSIDKVFILPVTDNRQGRKIKTNLESVRNDVRKTLDRRRYVAENAGSFSPDGRWFLFIS